MTKVFTSIQDALSAPFPSSEIEWRTGMKPYPDRNDNTKWKAQALAYLNGRHIMNRLDEVVGIGNWQSEMTKNQDGSTFCRLSLFLGGRWVTKTDGSEETDFDGVKGGISTALKRAAVQFGIGRYLYSFDSPYVYVAVREVNDGRGGKKMQVRYILNEEKEKLVSVAQELSDEYVRNSSNDMTFVELWGMTQGRSFAPATPDDMLEKLQGCDAYVQNEGFFTNQTGVGFNPLTKISKSSGRQYFAWLQKQG